ncbi:Elongation factor G 2 [Bienertia sinuspersici]
MTRYNSTPLPLCFRPTTTTPAIEYPHAPPSSAATTTTTSSSSSTTPNLTTCLYQTHLGIFSLTWSRSLMSRSFNLHLHPSPSLSTPPLSLSSPSFHLTLKPLLFWTKQGVKKLPPPCSDSVSPIYLFWDLTHAKFGPGPEPVSGFYIAVVFEGEIVLLVGDLEKEAFAKTKLKKSGINNNNNNNTNNNNNNSRKLQSLVIRREHVFGNRFYTTRTDFGGKSRLILIELNTSNEEDPRLVIRFDSKRVLQVKHLKWKFRGSERIEVDGYPIQLSWDVYNWLFDEDCGTHDDYALFTFRFEKQGNESMQLQECFDYDNNGGNNTPKKGVIWSQDSCGLNYERKKMKKKLLVKTRSSSSSSISSASSGSSSVLEWESVEENELKGPTGFSLMVYAWKS